MCASPLANDQTPLLTNEPVLRTVTLTGTLANGTNLDRVTLRLGMPLEDVLMELGMPDNYIEDVHYHEITLVYDIKSDSYLFSFSKGESQNWTLINIWATGGY
jgi:hypothetical protein